MANWIGVITNGGSSLLAQWTQGGTLNIKSAAAGTGTVPDQALLAQVRLVNQKQSMSIVSSSPIDAGRVVKLQLTAHTEAYTLNQIGVWAALDNGDPVLMALFQNSVGVYIPDNVSQPDFAYSFFATLTMSNAGDVEITIDSSALVSQGTLEETVSDLQTYTDDAIAELNIGDEDISDIGDGTVKGAIHAVNELAGKAVRYDTNMSLTSSQKERARKNIGVLINLEDTITHTQYRLGIENGIMYIEDVEEE